MMKLLVTILSLLFYAFLGGFFIREAIVDFTNCKYFSFGLDVMVAIMEAAYIFKTVLQG